MGQRITGRQLVWSLVVAAFAVVAASALALVLIPQLSVDAAIRGGTIALGTMAAARVGVWAMQRKH